MLEHGANIGTGAMSGAATAPRDANAGAYDAEQHERDHEGVSYPGSNAAATAMYHALLAARAAPAKAVTANAAYPDAYAAAVEEEQPPRRGRGRPPGSKNKPKSDDPNTAHLFGTAGYAALQRPAPPVAYKPEYDEGGEGSDGAAGLDSDAGGSAFGARGRKRKSSRPTAAQPHGAMSMQDGEDDDTGSQQPRGVQVGGRVGCGEGVENTAGEGQAGAPRKAALGT